MDVFDKCREYRLANLIRERGVYPYFRRIESAQDPVVMIDGRPMIMLGSNNYLGLTTHPEVKEAAIAAIRQFGTGCAGSRLVNGTLAIHVELEERLAAFIGRESALTFATGFQVNLGVLSCLLDRHDALDRPERRADELRALAAGLDLGLTLIDTAELYGVGASEKLVREAIRGRRDEVSQVTKLVPENASKDGTPRAAERSLRRLGVDRIDLYLLHWAGRYPLEETFEAFERLVEQGKIRWWGVSEAMLDLHDRPDLVHAAVDRMVAGWSTELDQFLAQNLLSGDANNTRIVSGGYGYTKSLPSPQPGAVGVRPQQMRGCSNAQIFSEVSPDMHWEFALKHDFPWLSRWGLIYYGCCEPLDFKMDLLRRIPNLRFLAPLLGTVLPTAAANGALLTAAAAAQRALARRLSRRAAAAAAS